MLTYNTNPSDTPYTDSVLVDGVFVQAEDCRKLERDRDRLLKKSPLVTWDLAIEGWEWKNPHEP